MRSRLAARLARGASGSILLTAALGPAQSAQAAQAVFHVPCSASALASAITTASSGAALSLAPRCHYSLTEALPAVGQDLTIAGNGATLVRSYAPGTATFTILTLDAGSLTLADLNFRHGDGAVLVRGPGVLTINGGVFAENTAANGGAIDDMSENGTQVNGATFIGNSAANAGGAIYAGGLNGVVVKHSTFIGNTAGQGGALFDFAFEGSSLSDSRFTGNKAGSGGALDFDAVIDGSASHILVSGNYATVEGGGILAASNFWSISDSVISGNHADGNGGGLVDYSFATSSIQSSYILRNSADYGGGLYLHSGDLKLTTNLIAGNHARIDGGGVYAAGSSFDLSSASFADTTIRQNYAGRRGGGIYNQADVAATRTSIVDNAATGGGGIYNDGPAAAVTLTGSNVLANIPDNCEPHGSIAMCTG
jgi:predicted outer membrane repeat protein